MTQTLCIGLCRKLIHSTLLAASSVHLTDTVAVDLSVEASLAEDNNNTYVLTFMCNEGVRSDRKCSLGIHFNGMCEQDSGLTGHEMTVSAAFTQIWLL